MPVVKVLYLLAKFQAKNLSTPTDQVKGSESTTALTSR